MFSDDPDLFEPSVPEEHFPRERTRALVGVFLYILAGAIGSLVTPWMALVIFLLIPAFYGITSEGLYQLNAIKPQR
jgi:hypothetical protein